MTFLKALPSKQRLMEAKKVAAGIFQSQWNPTNIRNGAKVLRAPLRGPKVALYYGKNEDTPTFKDFREWFPELGLTDPKEEYRLKMVRDRKKRNKGAPKKKTS